MKATQSLVPQIWILMALIIAALILFARHYQVQYKIRRFYDDSQNVHWHSTKEKGLWRAWLTINNPNHMNRVVDFNFEIAWLKKVSPGFRIHFGDRGSETPFHWDVSFYWVAFFFSMRTPNMGAFFEKLCRGYTRNFTLRFHSGRVWWDVWYDDSMGYDDHHKCNLWDPPKFWPFRNKKYRPWQCLRRGSMALNPLDLWWGTRYYSYETVDEDTLLIEINQFPGDEYMVEFTVQHQTQARRYGPRFVRHVTDRGYVAEWSIPDNGTPIPTKAPGRGCIYGSSVPIPNPLDWRMDADDALKAWVLKQRKMEGFASFDDLIKSIKSITPVFDSMHGKMLEFGVAAGKASSSLKKFAIEFEKSIKKDGGIIATPENIRSATSPIYNEVLKSQYTPAELAQQAINRDADPRVFFEQVADVQEIVDEVNRKEV